MLSIPLRLQSSLWSFHSAASGCRLLLHPFTSQVVQNRRYAIHTPITSIQTDDKTLSDPPKTKPKATTPLRRSASASLPIRANPTPTRGDIQTVFTLATAERYLLSRLRLHPDLPARSQTLHESWWVPKWGQPGKEGEVFVFANGSFVCWGLGEDDAHRFAIEVLDRAPGIAVAPLKEPETEELEFVTDPIELGGTFNICERYLTYFLSTGIRDCKVT